MNARLLFGAALAALAMAAVAHAAEPGTFFVRDATVHTVGPRGTLAHADVLVERGRVKAIGTKLTVPAGVEVVEAGGRPLTPGLFAGLSGTCGLALLLGAMPWNRLPAGPAPAPKSACCGSGSCACKG